MTPTGSIASMASASRDGEAISVANWLTLFATPSPTIPSTTPAVAHTKSMYGNPAGTVAVVDDIGRATDRMLALLATRQIKAGRAVAEVRESVEGAARHSVSMMRESARLQASVERAVAMDDRLRDLEQRLEDALALAAELLGEEEVTFLSVPGTPITRRHTAESETT
ncbi:hypothetical protein BC828DRAFT_375621 [Blastocladiella britannica]|nr:hypothetical protein BC828DRAFT_375621 [Blastocladiella britannica]